MAAIQASGSGWINFEPVIEAVHEPPEPGPFAFLGGSTHKVPVITWMPAKHHESKAPKSTTVGLQHASGPRVAGRLRDLGFPFPEGWRVTQDHPRRGLVVEVPAHADNQVVVGWLMAAAEAVCQVPSTGRWEASVHTGLV
jgi:hypothetical protein